LQNSHQNSRLPKIKMEADLAAAYVIDFIGVMAPQVGLKVWFCAVRDHPIEITQSFIINNITSVQVRRLPTKAVKICWPFCWPLIIVIG
jgi:hypothetical protein